MNESITSKEQAVEIVSEYAPKPEKGIFVQLGQQTGGLTAAEIVLQELHAFGLSNMPTKFVYALAERLITESGYSVLEVKLPDEQYELEQECHPRGHEWIFIGTTGTEVCNICGKHRDL